MAHPDDECIFGWPIFQNPTLDKALLVLASDRNNPERAWCVRRMDALTEICEQFGIALTGLDMDSEFYRTPYRRADFLINDIYREVGEATRRIIADFRPDLVFCHNPHGEYGMFDHRMVFDIVHHHVGARHVCITDICEAHPDWPSFAEIPARERALFYDGRPHVSVTLDPEFYVHCKSVYDRYGCWTWKDAVPPAYPLPSCRLHLLSERPTPEVLRRFEALGTGER